MSREKTAEFLADCLSHMPLQRGDVKVVVDTAIAGLTRIAEGGEWSRDEARAAADAAWAAAWAALAHWAVTADRVAAAWAAITSAEAAARSAAWAAWAADWAAADAADWAADYAARAHPDPDAERARQKAKRKELGI